MLASRAYPIMKQAVIRAATYTYYCLPPLPFLTDKTQRGHRNVKSSLPPACIIDRDCDWIIKYDNPSTRQCRSQPEFAQDISPIQQVTPGTTKLESRAE